jgi:phage shock protein PspC (stress-responsive transcriptional regulator)
MKKIFEKIRRSNDDKMFGGVCGGVETMIGIPSWFCRLTLTLITMFTLATITTPLYLIGVYILLWIFIPEK